MDVHADWVDACDAVAKDAASSTARRATNGSREMDRSSRQQTAAEKEEAEDSEDESSDEDDDSTPAEFPGHNEECKMVLVVRTDLGMTKGTATLHTHLLSTRYLTMR